VNNVLLINAALAILFLSAAYAESTHDKRIAEATPYPLRGRDLTRLQKAANRRIARRRVRIEHVNSSVKRCRMVHDICRLRKAGVRDLVMEVCCGLHNFRLRLTPWQAMVSSG
jgi:hypothetical protein